MVLLYRSSVKRDGEPTRPTPIAWIMETVSGRSGALGRPYLPPSPWGVYILKWLYSISALRVVIQDYPCH